MNKAAPWSIKGVDFDARDAAREAARRAGMSLGEWLNEVISDQARDMGVAFDEVDDEGRLEAVTARLASMSPKGRRTIRRADPVDDEAEAPRHRAPQNRPRPEIRETLYTRAPRENDERDEPAQESFGNAEALLDAAIRAYERGASRGEQATAEISKVSRRLENIEHRLTSAFDDAEPRADEKYARLEARLEALARDKEFDKSERSIKGIERRLEEMAERFDKTRAAPPPAPAPVQRDSDVTRLESKLNRLIETIDQAPRRAPEPTPSPDVSRLESRINKLIDTLDAPRKVAESTPVQAPAALSPVVRRLTSPEVVGEAVAQITRRQRDLETNVGPRSARVAQAAEPATAAAPDPMLQALRADVAALTRQLDETHRAFLRREPVREAPAVQPDPAVATLRQEISALHRRLEETEQAVVTRIDEQARNAERHVPAIPSDPGIAALRQEIAGLNRRVEDTQRTVVARIEEQSRVTERLAAPAQPDPGIAALKLDIAGLNRQVAETQRTVVDRIEEHTRAERAPAPEMDALRKRIDEMSRSLTNLAPRDAVASLDGAIKSLGARVEESLRDHSKENLLRPIADLAGDLRRGLAEVTSHQGFESVERAIRDLGEKIENGGQGSVDARAVEQIHAQTRDIRDLLQKAITRPAPTETIERQIAKLTDRLDRAGGSDTDEAARPRLVDPADTAPVGMIELLAKRIDDLGRKIDDAVSQGGASDQLDELAKRIDDVHASIAARGEAVVSNIDTSVLEKMMRDIAEKLERPAAPLLESIAASPADTSRLEDMLKSMGARFDDASTPRDTRVVEELRDEVSRLAKLVESNGRSGGELTVLDDIRRDLGRLFELAESAPVEATDTGAISELRDQFGVLAGRLDRVDESARSLGSLESAIGELTHRIDDARGFAAETAETAARDAARAAINEVLGQLPASAPGAGPSADLTRELADIRSNQESIDRRTYSTLSAVHETLEKVVDRIAILEEEVGEPRPAPMLAVGDAPVFAPAAAPLVPPTAPRIPPVALGNEEPTQSIFKGRAFDELLEPGATPPRVVGNTKPAQAFQPADPAAGKPSEARKLMEAARRAAQANAVAAPQPVSAKETKAARAKEKSAVDQAQADVIARARAAEKVWPGLSGESEGGAAAGGLARVRNFISGRKYPLIVAGVVAIGAAGSWQVLNRHPSAPPSAEVVDMTSGASPSTQRAAPAPDGIAPAPSAPRSPDPSRRDGASLERPAAALPSLAAGRVQTDPAPVGSIGSTSASPVRGASLQLAAANGDPAAQYELAARYADGRTVTRDARQALDWFTKAAEQNLAPAQYRLGSIYERGLAGERDIAKARDWYKRAADAGNVRAMHNMAVLAAEGSQGKPDYPTAASWFKQAAEYGVRDSQYNLAILYARGLGIEQNLVQSWAWFAIAAAQGDTDAAKKQEDVGARLDGKQLDSARAIVAAFRPKAGLKAANDVAEPAGGWDATVRAEQKRDPFALPTSKPVAPKGKVTSL